MLVAAFLLCLAPALGQLITSCTVPGQVAYTYDDGPWNFGVEARVEFARYNANATFFVNGMNWGCIYDRAEELQAAFAEGHLIGSHTWSHADLTSLSDEGIRHELLLVEDALVKILGVKPKYLRPPFGLINDRVLNVTESMGYKVVAWNADSNDWMRYSADQIAAQTYEPMYTQYPRSFIALNHETYDVSAPVVAMTVPRLQAAGYSIQTVAHCLDDPTPYEYVGPIGVRDATWTCAGTPRPW